jgi:hypothetical protein
MRWVRAWKSVTACPKDGTAITAAETREAHKAQAVCE